MSAVMVETVEALHEAHGGPFVRTRLTADTVRTVWRLGDAVVVSQSHDRHGEPVTSPVLVCLGDPERLAPLVREVSPLLPGRPGWVTVEAHAFDALPLDWRPAAPGRWESMWTEVAPPRVAGEECVQVVTDLRAVDTLLDRANPDSHGRPGGRDIRAWVGVREGTELVATGALAAVGPAGVAHVRGVSTLPRARGRGLGTSVSARLTRMGLDTMSPLVTLGVYTANETAISLYRRLGYRLDRRFVSGVVPG